jgi:hypothetical protein
MPIIYGYPMEEAIQIAKHGEAVLGGCLVFDDAPNTQCEDCRRQFST